MNMHLCEIEIEAYFFEEMLKFEIDQCHNNYSSQHLQAHFLLRRKFNKLIELKRQICRRFQH